MAINRTVSTGFWTDTKVLDNFSPEDKFFFLYLMTNPLTNISGCYELPIGEATHKTGYNRDTVYGLLKKMEEYHDVIRYDRKTGEVLILNWGNYNWGKSPLVKKSVLKFAEQIKNPKFKEYVLKKVEGKDFTAPGKAPKQEETEHVNKSYKEEEENTIPDLGDCVGYAKSKGLKGYTGTAFYYSQERTGWKDANGNPINDWRKYFDRCVENGSIGNEVI